eukprot:1661947-Prymnesium_polylepis.1
MQAIQVPDLVSVVSAELHYYYHLQGDRAARLVIGGFGAMVRPASLEKSVALLELEAAILRADLVWCQ